jgi:hypothetical protein
MGLDAIWKALCDEWGSIKQAPRSFGVAVIAVIGLVSLIFWSRYDTKIDNLDSALKSKDAQIGQLQSTISFQAEQLTVFRQIPASKTAAPAKSENANTVGSADIQFFADVHAQPKLISSDNLWRWNYTVADVKLADQQGKEGSTLYKSYAVFLVFDKPVNFKKMLVSSSSNVLPSWSLVDSSERTAMIMFWGDISDRTVSFRVSE